MTSAALLHGPRPPASVSAFNRTYLAELLGKLTTFVVESSANWPVATGLPQVVPSVETWIWYWPMFPLRPVASGRGW